MVTRPTQLILCGLPFSGKTTLGRALTTKLGFAHVNLDEIKMEKGFGSTSDDDVPDRVWKEMFTENTSQTKPHG